MIANDRKNADKIDEEISIIVPVFQAQNHIVQMVEKATAEAAVFLDYQLILVDDCSTDNTFDVIKRLAKQNQHIAGIKLHRHCGQQMATFTGLQYAKKRIVATIDDDLQQNPKDIVRLYHALKKGYDVVYGTNSALEQGRIVRRFGTHIRENTIAKLSKKNERYPVTSFRVMTKTISDRIIQSQARRVYLSMEILKITSNISFVPVRYEPKGKSRYSIFAFFKTLLSLHLNYGWFSRIIGISKQEKPPVTLVGKSIETLE